MKITAACYENNVSSKKAFEKAGYKVEGFLHSHDGIENRSEGVLWQLGILSGQ